MVELAQKHSTKFRRNYWKLQLKRIKKNVDKFYDYFRDNYISWHKWRRFLYVSNLSKRDLAYLRKLEKPEIEFNILEAYVSRQKGEFAKQEPSIEVQPGNNKKVDSAVIATVEGHIRHSEQLMREDNTAYQIYDDMMSGGYSVAEVYTKYSDEMSFEQDIGVRRVFDPTLCGFDPVAKESHKGDGEYCFEIMPYREKEFKELFPQVDISQLNYSRQLDKFNWSYKNNSEKIIMLCTYYEKKKKRVKIVKLADENVMFEKDYEKFLIDWEMDAKNEQPPAIVDERMTEVTNIVRYRFIENAVIDYKETDFSYLPLVFMDGNSVTIRENMESESKQYTRPYFYQARGSQQLKNLAGQTLANEIETMVQHKFKIPEEGIPNQQEYIDALTSPQLGNVLVYKQFKDKEPNVRLDPIQEVARVPTPPEVANSFIGADQTTQNILGTYDAALGIQKQQLSGVAIIEGATQSNATAMPCIVGYLNGLNQIALIKVDLIPKYYVTPRSIPVINKEGKRVYQMINQQGQPTMKYSSNALNVKVTPGVNFAIQKTRALQQVSVLMKTSPKFAEFFGETPEGIKFILDNLEMKGISQLKDAVNEFLAKEAQQQPAPDPRMLKVQLEGKKAEQDAQQNVNKNHLAIAELGIKDKEADTERLKVLGELGQKESDRELARDKIVAEDARTMVQEARATVDTLHRHAKDKIELDHKIAKEGK